MKKKSLLICTLLFLNIFLLHAKVFILSEGETKYFIRNDNIKRYFADDHDIVSFSNDLNKKIFIKGEKAGETFVHLLDKKEWIVLKIKVVKPEDKQKLRKSIFSNAKISYENESNNKNFIKGYVDTSDYSSTKHKFYWKQKTSIGYLDSLLCLENVNDNSDLGYFRTKLKHNVFDLVLGDNDISLSPQTIPYLHLQGISLYTRNWLNKKIDINIFTGEQNFGQWGNDTRGESTRSGYFNGIESNYLFSRNLSLGIGIFDFESNLNSENEKIQLLTLRGKLIPFDNLTISGETSSTDDGNSYYFDGLFDSSKLKVHSGIFKVDADYYTTTTRVMNWAQKGSFFNTSFSFFEDIPVYYNYRQYKNLNPNTIREEKKDYINSYSNFGFRYNIKKTGAYFAYSNWYHDKKSYQYGSEAKGSSFYIAQPWKKFNLYWRKNYYDYLSVRDDQSGQTRDDNGFGVHWYFNDKLTFSFENQAIDYDYTSGNIENKTIYKNIISIQLHRLQVLKWPLFLSGYINNQNGENISVSSDRNLTVTKLRLDYLPTNRNLSAFGEAIFTNSDSDDDNLSKEKVEYKFGLKYSLGQISPKLKKPKLNISKNEKLKIEKTINIRVKVRAPIILVIDRRKSLVFENYNDRKKIGDNIATYSQDGIITTLTE